MAVHMVKPDRAPATPCGRGFLLPMQMGSPLICPTSGRDTAAAPGQVRRQPTGERDRDYKGLKVLAGARGTAGTEGRPQRQWEAPTPCPQHGLPRFLHTRTCCGCSRKIRMTKRLFSLSESTARYALRRGANGLRHAHRNCVQPCNEASARCNLPYTEAR